MNLFVRLKQISWSGAIKPGVVLDETVSSKKDSIIVFLVFAFFYHLSTAKRLTDFYVCQKFYIKFFTN